MIVDAHAHIFLEMRGLIAAGPTRGLGYGRIAIGDEEVQFLPPLGEKTAHTAEMLLAHMDWAGVDKAVLLQGPFYGECNGYVLEAVSRYPDRFIGAAYFDPWAPDSRQAFEAIGASSFRAVKLECSEATGLCGLHPEARLDTPGIAWLWDELERQRLVLVLDLGAVGSRSYQTGAVRAIAEAHPDLKIVIAHLAQPTPAAEADPGLWHLWLEQIELGKLPNVWFDTASLPAYLSHEGYPFPSAERYLRLAIDRISPARVMWGSDLPGLLAYATYPQLVKLARLPVLAVRPGHTQFLSPHEQAMVLGGNASQVYGC
jgi:predicted TIM-barrel fold metal-dependent hydrolase